MTKTNPVIWKTQEHCREWFVIVTNGIKTLYCDTLDDAEQLCNHLNRSSPVTWVLHYDHWKITNESMDFYCDNLKSAEWLCDYLNDTIFGKVKEDE